MPKLFLKMSNMLLISQFVTNQICSRVTDLLSFVSLAFLHEIPVPLKFYDSLFSFTSDKYYSCLIYLIKARIYVNMQKYINIMSVSY